VKVTPNIYKLSIILTLGAFGKVRLAKKLKQNYSSSTDEDSSSTDEQKANKPNESSDEEQD
jgi:hypothetical protein